MTNPKLIIVCLASHVVVDRTTWGQWAIDNGSALHLNQLTELADKLRDAGSVIVKNQLIVAVCTTDADVMAFLQAKIDANRDVFVPNDCLGSLMVTCHGDGGFTRFIASTKEVRCQSGETADEAIAKVRANILSPKDLAEKKRAEAQRLLDEANSLHPVAA